ncbi:hypothetical protein BC826DRAFT_1049109 [Russula brevipes]|nr:hypothetical protein BC826DRAFT_1049109 [Russula brevipes]
MECPRNNQTSSKSSYLVRNRVQYKIKVLIPPEWKDHERVQFGFDPGCEAMIYTTDGTPL